MNIELNDTVWATLAPSKIHGIGVFAIREIPEGQKIYAQSFEHRWLHGSLEGVHPAIQQLIHQRWPIRDRPFLSPNSDARLISFMNHADTPNYDASTDTALRVIHTGEEIVEDYGVYKKRMV